MKFQGILEWDFGSVCAHEICFVLFLISGYARLVVLKGGASPLEHLFAWGSSVDEFEIVCIIYGVSLVDLHLCDISLAVSLRDEHFLFI